MAKQHKEAEDEVIVVTMPKGDYDIMRQMIDDRKSAGWVLNKVTTFSLTLSGVIAAWIFLGESVLDSIKGVFIGGTSSN